MKTDEILVDRDGPVAVLTINRAEHNNAINNDILMQLRTAVMDLECDGTTRAVVIRGAGGKFSVGFDVTSKKPRSAASVRDHADLASDTFWRVWRSPLPFIASAERCCLGGAVYFSGVCDFMITSPSAEIGLFELKIGMSPPLFNIFPWMMGYRAAKQFLLTGDIIDGNKALEWGLASHCVAEDQIIPTSMALAHRLASMPDSVVAKMKRSVNRRWELAGVITGVEDDVDNFVRDKLSMGQTQQEFRKLVVEYGVEEAIVRLGIDLGLRERYRQ